MKLIFAADIHLRETIWVKHPNIYGDSFKAFLKLCEYAYTQSKTDKTVLVLGGDIFDSVFPSGKCEQIFTEGIHMLKGQVPVFFVEGNHDREEVARPLLWGCTKLTEVPIEINGTTICGINYTRDKEKLQTSLANLLPCDFLVMHSPFKHLLGFSGKWQLEASDIPEHIGNVLVGDIHVKSIYKNIYSPGSLSVNGVSEFNTDHGFFVFDTECNAVEYVPIKTREFQTMYWPIAREDIVKLEPIEDAIPVVQLVFTTEYINEVDTFIDEYPNIQFIKSVRAVEDTAFDVDSPSLMSKEEVLSSSLTKHLGDTPEALLIAIDLLLNPSDTVLTEAYKEHMNAANKSNP